MAISNDMLDKKCRKCKKGRYIETSYWCDAAGDPLSCSKCGHTKQRWTETKEKTKKREEISEVASVLNKIFKKFKKDVVITGIHNNSFVIFYISNERYEGYVSSMGEIILEKKPKPDLQQ